LGQSNSKIEKPENYFYNVYYNPDNSITFNHGNRFSANQLPALIKIFETADELSKYCEDSCKIDIEKIITVTDIYKFVYVYEYDPISHRKYSTIEIRNTRYQRCNVDSEIPRIDGNKFIYYLTKHRDEYYEKFKIYNNYVEKINNKLDSIINIK
jgi:hypothetical protein